MGGLFLSFNSTVSIFEEKECINKKKRDYSINIVFNFYNPFTSKLRLYT